MIWVAREHNLVPTPHLHGQGCYPLPSFVQDLIHLGLEHIQGWKWDPASSLQTHPPAAMHSYHLIDSTDTIMWLLFGCLRPVSQLTIC